MSGGKNKEKGKMRDGTFKRVLKVARLPGCHQVARMWDRIPKIPKIPKIPGNDEIKILKY